MRPSTMPERTTVKVRIPAVFLVSAFAWLLTTPLLLAQSVGCSPEETAALLSPADPAYDDAIELARTLSEHGFTINCVLTSKLGGLFNGLEGAALFRTTDGDFDALFLPKPKTFADLKIVERQLKKGFAYFFAGKPRSWSANRLESVRREYFINRGSQLLVLSDDPLRTKLESVLNPQ